MKYILKADTDNCDMDAAVKGIYLISSGNNIVLRLQNKTIASVKKSLKDIQACLNDSQNKICVYNGLYDFQMLAKIFSAAGFPEFNVNAKIIDLYRQVYLQDKRVYKLDILYTQLTKKKAPANSFEIQNRLKMLNDIYALQKMNFREFLPEEYFI